MIKEPQIPLLDLVVCLSEAMDLISSDVVNHHKRVAYIALGIAAEMSLSKEEQNNLLLAGLVHDSGALSLKEKLDDLRFEFEFETGDAYKHAYLGYLLLKRFEPLSDVAHLVRYHHAFWDWGSDAETEGDVPTGSHILHLADRVDILVNRQKEVLGQVKGICDKVEKHSGTLFAPDLVRVFRNLASKEYFWLDAISPSISSILARRSGMPTTELDLEGLLGLARLFCQIIDFRSRFTATHSSGVSSSAEALSRFAGFSERECQMMRIAGYLHDLGKLAVPGEILEKPAKLTENEFNIIRSHTFHTYRILETISDLDIINTWASFHHERLDGSGYPFHIKGQDLSLGSRIMAVADVFTAITEARPYRKEMPSDKALQLLQEMADNSRLDSNVVSTLKLHFDDINSVRIAAQAASVEEYRQFLQPPG